MLQECPASIRTRLAAAWTSLMLLFVYGDYFGLYLPGKLAEMNRGIISPLGTASPLVLLSLSAMMAIPAAMVGAAAILPAQLARGMSLLFGVLYAAIMILTMLPGAAPFYMFLGVLEVALALGIAVLAWRWPRVS